MLFNDNMVARTVEAPQREPGLISQEDVYQALPPAGLTPAKAPPRLGFCFNFSTA